MKTQSPVFIVGMSRAGTTWLANCLSQHPEVSVFGESAYWGKRFLAPSNGSTFSHCELEKIVRSMARVRITHRTTWFDPNCPRLPNVLNEQRERLFQAPMGPGEFFEFIRQRIAELQDTPYVIEKTPHHVNWANRILKYLPGSRFIIHIREPYGFMRSYKHQGDRKPGDVQRTFQRRYHPLACAMVWRGYARSISELLSAHPQKALIVRFEEIQTEADKVLADVQNFLQLPTANLNLPVENSSFPTGVKPELAPADIFAMNLCARREIHCSGFAEMPANGGWGAKAAVVASFPWWAASNLAGLNRIVHGSTREYLMRWLK